MFLQNIYLVIANKPVFVLDHSSVNEECRTQGLFKCLVSMQEE